MAFPLSSSFSSLCHDHQPQPLCNLLSPSHVTQFSRSLVSWAPRNFNHLPKLALPTQPRSSGSSSLSLLDPVPQESQYPSLETIASTGNYIWVNPKNPRASELRQKSHNARYDFLAKVSESLDSCDPNEVDVSRVLSMLGENPVAQDAVVVLNYMENPETALIALDLFKRKVKSKKEVVLYNATMNVFRKIKNLERAELLFEEMLERGIRPDRKIFSTLISCARLASCPNKALEWFEKMPEFGCEPDDIINSAMIDAYGQMGDFDKALDLYAQAKREKWRIDIVSFSTVIKIHRISGDFDGALNVYEELRDLKMKPNLSVYNSVLDILGKAKRPWQIKSIIKDMAKNRILPNYLTYAAVLRAYCKDRNVEDALSIYREMKEKGFELKVVLYNTIIAMCAEGGYCDEAIEIFEDMRSETCKPDSWTYSSLIKIYSHRGNISEVERTFNEMLEAGFEPDSHVLTSLIQCYGKEKRTDDVLKMCDRLLESGAAPDERFCCCFLYVMNETPKEEIGRMVRFIERAVPKLGYVIKLVLEEETSDRGFRQEAAELIESISTDVRKAYCNCLLDLCVNLDRMERACELLKLGLTLNIYRAIQIRSATRWSLMLKTLSLGAAITALHMWKNDMAKALVNGEKLPPVLAINTGHGKHNSGNALANMFASHLRDLHAPFHEDPDNVGWLRTTKVAARSWLEPLIIGKMKANMISDWRKERQAENFSIPWSE